MKYSHMFIGVWYDYQCPECSPILSCADLEDGSGLYFLKMVANFSMFSEQSTLIGSGLTPWNALILNTDVL